MLFHTVARWAATFQHGRIARANMHQTGRPRTERTDAARAVIAQCLEDDRQWSQQELQAHTGIDQATVHKILREDLNMRKIAAKWVPHALTEQQKWCRYETCRIHLERYQNEGENYETCRIHLERYQNEGENLLNNIITIDETWVRAYELQLRRQSAEWRHEDHQKEEISSESISYNVNGNFGL